MLKKGKAVVKVPTMESLMNIVGLEMKLTAIATVSS